MKFSDTTNKSGLVQDAEFWTGLGDTGISGNATLLKIFTSLFNAAYDELLPLVFGSDAKWQWDDPSHADQPIGTTSLVSGQADYSFISDENGNSILEIQAVYIQNPQGKWVKLNAIDSEDAGNDAVFAQNSTNTGTPTRYDKQGVSVWLDPVPNYSVSSGVRAVFARTPDYFTSADTTQTPGIPAPFHRLLSMIGSRDWLAVNKPESTTLINVVTDKITERKTQLKEHMSKRSKDEKPVARPRTESSR